jgi:hypothetical protein
MSDLPPEGPRPPQPEGGSEAPGEIPNWAASALTAVRPAPEIQTAATPGATTSVVPAWSNDPAVSQVPPFWARPTTGTDSPAPSPTPIPDPAQAQAQAPAEAQGAPMPPAGWYTPIPAGPAAQTQAAAWPVVPAQSLTPRRRRFDRARWLPTLLVAAIIAAVTLGGIGLDTVIAAPSAGSVAVGGSVRITAAPGWVLVSKAGDTSGGIKLQKANAILTAQVVSTSFSGGSASILPDAEKSIGTDTAQVSYGDPHHGTFGGNDSTYVSFEATVTSGNQTGIVDGELVCIVVQSNETIIIVAAPQGHLDPVIDDVSAMLKSLRAG